MKRILDTWLNQCRPEGHLDDEKFNHVLLGFSNLMFPFLALLSGILISMGFLSVFNLDLMNVLSNKAIPDSGNNQSQLIN